MRDIITEYKNLAGAAFVDDGALSRKGHSGPLAYSYFAERTAALHGRDFPKDEAALEKLNAFRAEHGETLEKLLAA